MKRATIIGATIAAIVTMTPGLAFANPSSATMTCEGGVTYEGHDYPAAANTVTISIDGHVVKAVTFSVSTSGTVPNPDKTAGHTWSVVWDRFDGTNGDRTQSGSVTACREATTTTTAATTTTTLVTINTLGITPTTTTTVPCLKPCSTTTTAAETTTTLATFVCAGTFVGDVCVLPTTPAPPTTAVAPSIPVTGLSDGEVFAAVIVLLIGAALVYAARRRNVT